MKVLLVVLLGLVALAAASNSRYQDSELSELKKLLLRALEKRVEETKKADDSQPKTVADTEASKEQEGTQNPSDNAHSTATNQGSSEVKPATQKEEDEAKPAPNPTPTTEVDEWLGSAENSSEQIEFPQELKPAHEKPAEDKKPAANQSMGSQSPVMPEPHQKPEDASHKPANAIHKPANGTHRPANATHKPANATHKPANAAQRPANATHKPANATQRPANATHKPAEAAQKSANVVPSKPAVLLPPHVGQGTPAPTPTESQPQPDKDVLEHPTDVVIMPEDKDEYLPAAPEEKGLLNMPISVLAFMMSSDVMKAAPLATEELVVGIHNFDVILRHVIRTLRRVADDVRKAPSLADSAMQIESDMEDMARVFIPAQSRASAAFFRVMVYGLEERLVCDLESEEVTDCVAGRMQALARLFTDPEHMDAEINKMERCNDFVHDKSGGKHAVADDMECIADGVSKVLDYLRKMKDTVSEIQLAGLLDGRPLPRYHMDLDDVEHEVADELQEQFKAIMSLTFRLMLDASEMGRSLDS